MPKSVLYYPTIDIQNGAWIRKALLYWDTISSIVPNEYAPTYSPEIAYLRDEELYKPTFPSTLFCNSTAYRDFQEDVLTKIQAMEKGRGIKIENRMSLHRSKFNWPELSTQIHYGKIPGPLYEYLKEHFLLTTHSGSEWLEMDSNTASLFMSTLAGYLAKVSSSPMIISTDESINLGKAFTKTLPCKDNFCFTMALEGALPVPTADIALKKLVKFRNKRSNEFLRLQERIDVFENDISLCGDIQEMKGKTETFRNEWILAVDDYRKMLRDERIECSLGTMKTFIGTSVPGIITGIAETIGWPPTGVTTAAFGFGGAVSIGYSYMKYKKAVHKLQRENSFAYLYEAERRSLVSNNRFV